jgi:hypothetical protein
MRFAIRLRCSAMSRKLLSERHGVLSDLRRRLSARFSARAASSAPASALGRVLDPLTRTHAHQRNGRRRAASDRRSGDFQDGGTRTRRKTELSCPRRSLSFFVASARVRDLLIRAKDLLEGALQRITLRFMTPIAKV